MTTEQQESAEGQGTRLCTAGSKSPNPCRREATEPFWADEDGPPELCAEHAERIRRMEERDNLFTTLYSMQEWMAGAVKESRDPDLERYAYTMRDKAEEDLWPAMVAATAALLIASQSQDEKPLAPEQAERLAVLLLRSDALNNARAILEDLPEKTFVAHVRWEIVAPLKLMGEEVNEEVSRYKREIGLE
jgi:hypothetical protein